MIKLSIVFFVIAIIAAIFGFGGISETAADVGLFLFFVAFAAFAITLVAAIWAGKKTKDAF